MQSAAPEVDPFVDCNMLAAPRDRLRLRDGVRRLARIMAQEPVTRIAESIVFGAANMSVDYSIDPVISHELGHTFGLKHEHNRTGAEYDPHCRLGPDLAEKE